MLTAVRGPSIVAALGRDGDSYRADIGGGKRGPVDVPSGPNVRPRLESKPGDAPPGAPRKIPASSQRPGKRTNECIPYARLMFTEQIDGLTPVGDMLPGDVMMVYRGEGGLGSHSNRDTKCATWRQVNDVLLRAPCKDNRGTLHCLYAGERADVRRLRDAQLNSLLLALIEDATSLWKTFAKKSSEMPSRLTDSKENLFDYAVRLSEALDEALATSLDGFAAREHAQRMLLEVISLHKVQNCKAALPQFDWKAVPLLQHWSLDGILLSRDDDEYSASAFHATRADSSVVLNVAIQGHAAVRNQSEHAFGHGSEGAFAQMFDEWPKVGDVLYLLLIASRQGGKDEQDHLRFRFKPSCRSIIDGHVRSTWKDRHGRGGLPFQDAPVPAKGGLTLRELRHVCAGWKIGVVTDAALVVDKHRRLGVHVDSRPMTLAQLRASFVGVKGDAEEPCPIGSAWMPDLPNR